MHQCPLCPYLAQNLSKYKTHVACHSSEKPFKCPECPYRAKLENNVKAHVKRVHLLQSPSSRPFPCQHPGCSYAAKEKSILRLHSKVHCAEKSFSCSHPDCSFSTHYKRSLTCHTRIHLGEKTFVCPFESCSYASIERGHLVSHMRTHTKERPHKCPEADCKYAAAESGRLKAHRLNHHPKEGEEERRPFFKCPLCDYCTKFKGNVSVHIRRHTLEKSFICSAESCDARFHSKSELDEHMKSHGEERQYKCELCPFRGKTRKGVRSHLKQVHSDLRPFQCTEPECNFAAKTPANLKAHLLFHKGEKNYACSFSGCGYRAIQFVELFKTAM